MKKTISLILALVLAFGSMCIASAEDTASDFEVTADGVLTAYYGGEWVVIPQEVNGVPVREIGERAFFDLGISDVYLPEGLVKIGERAFEGSVLTSLTLSSTVKEIAKNAFANCTELDTVFFSCDETVTFGENALSGTKHLTFYINCDSKADVLEEKLIKAKGDRNFEFSVRHVASDYDEEGNVYCTVCGYKEEILDLPFTDVPYDSWYYDYVAEAYFGKIINGKSETKFDPNGSMTCAEAVKLAACIYATEHGSIAAHTTGPWYQPYLDYCYEYEILESNVTFDWNKPITRAQMAYIFSRCDPYEEWFEPINDVPMTDIPDVNASTPYAAEILILYNKGIAVGDTNMRYNPNSNIKRCEAAAIVCRITSWRSRIELPKG